MSNGALDATVKMTNCLLDDLRPNKKISRYHAACMHLNKSVCKNVFGLCRLIEKISEVAATEIPLIDFAYSMTENKSMNGTVGRSSACILLRMCLLVSCSESQD